MPVRVEYQRFWSHRAQFRYARPSSKLMQTSSIRRRPTTWPPYATHDNCSLAPNCVPHRVRNCVAAQNVTAHERVGVAPSRRHAVED